MKTKQQCVEEAKGEWLEAMDLWAKCIAIDFQEWAVNEGWRNYDSHETWINQQQRNKVVTTKELFKIYKGEQRNKI